MFELVDDHGPIARMYYGTPAGNELLALTAERFVAVRGLTGIRTALPVDYLDD